MQIKSEYEKVVNESHGKVLLSDEQIQNRIKELGKQLTTDYKGKNPIMIGVLNGSFIFIADLVRQMPMDIEIDFIKVSSYGDEKVSSGTVKVLKEVNAKIDERHVLIVEDIVDSGLSVTFLYEKLKAMNPKSLEFVSLLLKPGNAKLDFEIKYVGFEIPNDFVIGFGLDYKQVLRNLPAVYVME